MNSKIILSSIIHKRFGKVKYSFKYKVPSLYLDLDELEIIKSKIFSINSFNIFSFHEKDHGYRDGRSIREFIVEKLNEYKVAYKSLKIRILCFPRIFGYVFNPLTILYCFDESKLISIFYEVKNTSNEQHTYVFASGTSKVSNTFLHECKKNFYVSPFIGMKGKYFFKNKLTSKYINIIINLYDHKNKKILMASQSGKFTEFNVSKLLKYNLLNPLLGFKVMTAILFESIRIVFKGGKYYARNKKPNDTITFEGKF